MGPRIRALSRVHLRLYLETRILGGQGVPFESRTGRPALIYNCDRNTSHLLMESSLQWPSHVNRAGLRFRSREGQGDSSTRRAPMMATRRRPSVASGGSLLLCTPEPQLGSRGTSAACIGVAENQTVSLTREETERPWKAPRSSDCSAW